jgi:hypothetical protein
MIVVAALAGGIWYSAPQIDTAANGGQSVVPAQTLQSAAEKWRVSDGASATGDCTITLENAPAGAGQNIDLSSGCTATTPVAQASKWWEDAEGNIVLASAQGERIAEFTADESDGLVSVWPRHTLVTLTPAN